MNSARIDRFELEVSSMSPEQGRDLALLICAELAEVGGKIRPDHIASLRVDVIQPDHKSLDDLAKVIAARTLGAIRRGAE